MDVVFDPADDDGLAFESAENTTEILMELLAQLAVAQKGRAVFGGEDRVHDNFREGLRPRMEHERIADLIQPLQGWAYSGRYPG